LLQQVKEIKDKTMAQVELGDTVKINFTGRLDDGSVFDTSVDHDPLELRIGHKKIVPGFEDAIVGMKPGDSKTVDIPADKAFGKHQEELVEKIDRNTFPSDLAPKVGQRLKASRIGGQATMVTVTDFDESSVTIDANHSLAGQDLTFDIELLEIL
jgi:peptidylprolyl isomerase